MNTYIIMPEKGNWTEIETTSSKMAYRGVCCWYNPNRKVAVINKSTGGNLIKIIEN